MSDQMVRLIPFRIAAGGGILAVTEFDTELPFTPTRMFWISRVDEGAIRGNHAHRQCHQLILAMAGKFTVHTSRGDDWIEDFTLNDASRGDPSPALYLPPLTWLTISDIAPGSVILCLASHPYDVFDYIDDRDEHLRLLEAAKTTFHHQV